MTGDHIFYTGNGRIARVISAAAAKHLTPLTLELGGKSPVIVDSTADISISAKRILYGKINNCGQICVAPDFILAEKAIAPALIDAFKEHYNSFFPDGALLSESYGRIVSDAHFERLKGLLAKTQGKTALGGKWESDGGRRGIEPTVLVDVNEDDVSLQEYVESPVQFRFTHRFSELFGPILPILVVENVDEAISYISERYDTFSQRSSAINIRLFRDHPLVLYAFSNNEATKKKSSLALSCPFFL